MYEPQLWPEGIFVRRFYEARKALDQRNVTANTNDDVSVDGGTAAVKTVL